MSSHDDKRWLEFRVAAIRKYLGNAFVEFDGKNYYFDVTKDSMKIKVNDTLVWWNDFMKYVSPEAQSMITSDVAKIFKLSIQEHDRQLAQKAKEIDEALGIIPKKPVSLFDHAVSEAKDAAEKAAKGYIILSSDDLEKDVQEDISKETLNADNG